MRPAPGSRSEFMSLLQSRQRRGELPLLPGRVTEVAPGHGVLRIDFGRPAKVRNRLVQTALEAQQGPQVVVRGFAAGIDFDGRTITGGGFIPLFLSLQRSSEIDLCL